MSLRVLLDQDVSPTHVARLAALDVFAEHVAHIGLAGASDDDVLAHAFDTSALIVTKNVGDFWHLAESSALHAGMLLLRDGALRRLEEWDWIRPVVEHIQANNLDTTNLVFDVRGPRRFDVILLPE